MSAFRGVLASALTIAALAIAVLAGQGASLPQQLQQAEALRGRGTAESLRQAAALFELSAGQASAAGDRAHEAEALIGQARAIEALGEGRKAMTLFDRALPLYRQLGDRENEAWALNYGALALDRLGDRQLALTWMARAEPIARERGGRLEAITVNNLGVIHYDIGERAEALRYYLEALDKHRAMNNARGVATTLTNIGTVYDAIGDKAKAIDYLQQAVTLRETVGDPKDRATTLNNLGVVYRSIDDAPHAVEYFTRALPEWRAAGDRSGEAATLHNIGSLYELAGEFQNALDFYQQAMPLHRATSYRFGEANTTTNMGRVYATLGNSARALELYEQALAIHRAIGNKSSEATTLTNMGVEYATAGDRARALQLYEQALVLRRASGDRGGEAATLVDVGRLQASVGRDDEARRLLNEGLALHKTVGSRHGEARALTELGALATQHGDHAGAIAAFDTAVELCHANGDPTGEAFGRYLRARARRELGEFAAASADADAALAIVETLRRRVASPDLRASYFASVRDYYDLAIDLLMRRHQQEPGAGLDARALAVSERARARALIDLLAESGADIRAGVDPGLLTRERDARRVVNSASEQLARLLAGAHDDQQARRMHAQVSAAVTALRDVEHQIRAASPAYAALTQVEPPPIETLQQQLDPGSLWLEYQLGAARSYLWVIAPDRITSFTLPPKAEIEALAARVHDTAMRADDGRAAAFTANAARLSEVIIGPAAGLLGTRRLIVVSEGALEYVPFAALADPAAARAYTPLLAAHEVVRLPSMSALHMLRQATANRKPAAGALAVLADPVFDAADPRVVNASASIRGAGQTVPVLREVDDDNRPLARLIGSRREAAAILSLVPVATRYSAFDFDASRATIDAGGLSRYRIVHFATHSVLNTRHPELTGIVLSLVNRQGAPQDGFLRLHELFNLKLPAELVVLSACQTALGPTVRGEGIVGLARGFMYAGAARIVATQWKVDDAATAELMKRFYGAMLGPGRQRPAAALRAAQLSMWRDPAWQSPYYWAAFGVIGEWR